MNAPVIKLQDGLAGAGEGRSALITGVSGQDGSYMLDFLLALGYERVVGVERPVANRDDSNIRHHINDPCFTLAEMDLTDPISVYDTIERHPVDEAYNFGALSHVGSSFKQPSAYLRTNALGPLYLIKAIEKFFPATRMYQASTSEMFGLTPAPQGYDSPFAPDSPYATAKLEAHWQCVNAAQQDELFVSSCILFNHESARRPKRFVTSKILHGMRDTKLLHDTVGSGALKLGNISPVRDWNYAPEMVMLAWKMLQQDEPRTCLGGSGIAKSVADFLVDAARGVGFDVPDNVDGDPESDWTLSTKEGNVIACSDPEFIRPMKTNALVCSQEAIERTAIETCWRSRTTGPALIAKMLEPLDTGVETVEFESFV